MDNGLVRFVRQNVNHFRMSLNPYCSGQWSRTYKTTLQQANNQSLNPYCSGQWSRTEWSPRLLEI